MKIYSLKSGGLSEVDRLELARLLLKAGYSARIGKERPPGNNTQYSYFVEFWKGGNNESLENRLD